MIRTLRATYYFLRLGRPLFLVGGFALHGLGIVMALWTGANLDPLALLWGQIAITAVQIMTHYSNDYFDLAADAANTTPTRWSGGSRILAEGLLPPQVGLITAVVSGFIALLATLILALVVQTGPLTVPLLMLAIILAWSYSSPPLLLNMRGLGEVTGAILITGLTPLVGFYLQTGQLTRLPFLAVFPLACLQVAMLLIINFPDAQGDAIAGKRTLLHILGPQRAVRLFLLVVAMAYLSLPVLTALGLPQLVAFSLLLPAPLALWQSWRMARGAWKEPAHWNSLGFWGVGLLMGSVGLELGAFLLLLFLDSA
ncbi:MAG: prenyltransferase [Candidatus Promineifilaceae bacterium]|nr:prenyltransferase [Candidatus Promineifilaceae bacterium]